MKLTTHNVSREEKEMLQAYVDFLLKWNQKINLISKNTIPNIWERHILDSARLRKFIKADDRIIDIGSGGGLPGVVLSILGANKVVLVESDERKAAFLSEAKRVLGLGCRIVNERVEAVKEKADIIVARGFADLEKILQITRGVDCSNYFLLKGRRVEEEIVRAAEGWEFDYRIHEDMDGSCVLEVSKKCEKN